MNVSRRRRVQAGFTLAEVLVALFVAAGVVVALARLYQTVASVGVSLRSHQSDWNLEQFLRRQTLQGLPALAGKPVFDGRPDSLLFVSQHSAAASNYGAPVLAYYHYDRLRRALVYQERPVPPWWGGPPPPPVASFIMDFGRMAETAQVALRGVDGVEFAYHTGTPTDKWLEKWDASARLPAVVRLRYRRGPDTRELLLEMAPPFAVPYAPG